MKIGRTIVLKPRQMRVFHAAQEVAKLDGTEPTAKRIAEHTGLTEKQVQMALNACVKKGVLKRNKGATLQ